MLTGCTVDDYSIWIGNDTCDNISVIHNHLRCMPPREQPGQQLDRPTEPEAVQVIVSKGLVNLFTT